MNLVLTVCIGDGYSKLSKYTHPSLKTYASKINADFLCIDALKISESTPHWEKFQIFDLLNTYERILYLDSDLIVREDCPDLFSIVPKDKLGAFNEAPFVDRNREMMINVCKEYKTTLPTWNGKYYNTGVLVVSRCHKYLFRKPDYEYNGSFWEQGYLNMAIAQQAVAMFELEYRYNRMTCMDRFTGENRFASYMIHYAGCPNLEWVLQIIPKDLQRWKEDKNKYDYRRHIYVSVCGGLGDQICAEPAIRFMQKYIYPNDEIVVATHFPRLFKHFNNLCIIEHGKFSPSQDTPYFLMSSLPGPETVTWMVVSNLLSHTVDYCSIALLKRILAVKDKQIHLDVVRSDIDCINDLVDKPEELILVHPGKHWPSKTLPTQYWQDIIDGLSINHRVAIIGREDGNRGTVNVTCPKNAIDLRNLLDLGALIALISKAKLLMSNDSAPIHIAGAFDNLIVLLPTCKHPDHVLPYRNGSTYYKAIALYKKLPSDEFDARPTCVEGSSAEINLSDWDKYLMDPKLIIENTEELLNKYE